MRVLGRPAACAMTGCGPDVSGGATRSQASQACQGKQSTHHGSLAVRIVAPAQLACLPTAATHSVHPRHTVARLLLRGKVKVLGYLGTCRIGCGRRSYSHQPSASISHQPSLSSSTFILTRTPGKQARQ